MKFVVEFDERGTIKAIGASVSKNGKEGISMELRPRPGHKVATMEAFEIKDASDHARIIDVKRNYRVEEHQGQHRLVRK